MGLRERLDAGPVICAEGYVFELERRGYLQAGRVRARGRARASGGRAPAPPRLRPRRLGRRRGAHLLRAPREAPRHRPGGRARAAQPAGARDREAGRARDRDAARGRHLQHERLRRGRRGLRPARCGRCSRSRSAGPSTRASTSSSPRRISWGTRGADRARGDQGGRPARASSRSRVHRESATFEGWPIAGGVQAARGRREPTSSASTASGAPRTMLPLLRGDPRRRLVPCRGAARPVPDDRGGADVLRRSTDPAYPGVPGGRAFPTALEPFTCNRYEVADFAREAYGLGVRYLGVCCGAGPHHIRAWPRRSAAPRRRAATPPDMSRHAFFGTEDRWRSRVPRDISRRL